MTDEPSFSTRLEWPDRTSFSEADAAAVSAAPTGHGGLPELSEQEILRPEQVSAAPRSAVSSSSGTSLFLDAYDRLAERVLERLRMLREDLDAELAGIRSEVGSLRHAVDDVADRVQLRQMRAALDGLRSDVAELRSTVLEWPELERLSEDVQLIRASLAESAATAVHGPHSAHERTSIEALRQDIAELSATVRAQDEHDTDVVRQLGDLTDEVRNLRTLVEAQPATAVPSLAPIIEELASVRKELTSVRGEMMTLRRRVALRVRAEQ